ncbi:MAG: hypothetical protein ACFFCD_15645, partial [Promethearchaeota archaeon]
ETGRPVFNEKFGSIETQEVLLSGFLSAIYSFAESELSGMGIESMEIGEYILVYCFSHDLLFVMAADKETEDSLLALKTQVNYIKNSFLDEFPFVVKGGKDFWMNWDGNREIFSKFHVTLEDLIKSWTDVKVATSVAEKMDILEVYQQVFSRISRISFPLLKRGAIKKQLSQKLNTAIKHHRHVLNIDELSAIYDSKEKFLDVLSVNVFNPDLNVETVKATLHDLCFATLDVLREYLGIKKFNEEFHKHIQTYLKQDWNRIRDLGLDKAFISYLP